MNTVTISVFYIFEPFLLTLVSLVFILGIFALGLRKYQVQGIITAEYMERMLYSVLSICLGLAYPLWIFWGYFMLRF